MDFYKVCKHVQCFCHDIKEKHGFHLECSLPLSPCLSPWGKPAVMTRGQPVQSPCGEELRPPASSSEHPRSGTSTHWPLSEHNLRTDTVGEAPAQLLPSPRPTEVLRSWGCIVFKPFNLVATCYIQQQVITPTTWILKEKPKSCSNLASKGKISN